MNQKVNVSVYVRTNYISKSFTVYTHMPDNNIFKREIIQEQKNYLQNRFYKDIYNNK